MGFIDGSREVAEIKALGAVIDLHGAALLFGSSPVDPWQDGAAGKDPDDNAALRAGGSGADPGEPDCGDDLPDNPAEPPSMVPS